MKCACTKKKIQEKLKDAQFQLGLARNRASAMNPGPGIEEEIKTMEERVSRLKRILKKVDNG